MLLTCVHHTLALTCECCLAVVPAESFDWGRYICSNNTTGAPVSCFKHVSGSVADLVATPDLSLFSEVTLPPPACFKAPMGKCWGDIDEGVRVEVVNSDTNLSTKVYWIAEIIKLAGEGTARNAISCQCHVRKALSIPFGITFIFKLSSHILMVNCCSQFT